MPALAAAVWDHLFLQLGLWVFQVFHILVESLASRLTFILPFIPLLQLRAEFQKSLPAKVFLCV